jgi:hypothetical protein
MEGLATIVDGRVQNAPISNKVQSEFATLAELHTAR